MNEQSLSSLARTIVSYSHGAFEGDGIEYNLFLRDIDYANTKLLTARHGSDYFTRPDGYAADGCVVAAFLMLPHNGGSVFPYMASELAARLREIVPLVSALIREPLMRFIGGLRRAAEANEDLTYHTSYKVDVNLFEGFQSNFSQFARRIQRKY